MRQVRKWAVIGRLAAIVQRHALDRPRLEFETDLAIKLGLTRGALRNYADAVRLVRGLPDPALRQILFRSSAVAASTLARWLHRDPQPARAYIAKNTLNGAITNDRALLVAARQAQRSTQSRHTVPESAEVQLKTWLDTADDVSRKDLIYRLAPQLNRQYFDLTLHQPIDPLAQLLGLKAVLRIHWADYVGDFEWKPLVDRRFDYFTVSIIEVPSMVVFERFRTEARSIWARALAATVYTDAVFLVLPSSAARRHLLSRIPSDGAAWINHPPAPRRSKAGRWCESRPVIAKLGLRKIVVSTTRSFLADLFHEDQFS